jgi:hypothetical protein
MLTIRFRPLAAVASVLVVASAISQGGQEPGERKAAEKAARNQRIEGVVVKAEPVGEEGSRRVRLTVNTAAVWRDFARDTAANREAPPEKAAKKGEESVATKGQPESRQTLETIEVSPEARMEYRYRLTMDERSLGAGSARAARELAARDADPAAPPAPTEDREARILKLDQLKPGLWVHIRYHREGERDRADWVIALEPIREASDPEKRP